MAERDGVKLLPTLDYQRGLNDGATRTAKMIAAMLEGFIEAGEQADKELDAKNAPRFD